MLGINKSGLIAGFYGSGNAGDPNNAYLLTTPDTFTLMDFPGQAGTQFTGLNDKGVVVGYFYPTNNGPAVDNQFSFYERNGAFTAISDPNTPTHPNPDVLIENNLVGVNDHNTVVGFYFDKAGNSHGYTYNIKTGVFSADINAPGAVSTVTNAINNRGELAGIYTDGNGVTHGFLDNHGVFTTINAPGASTTELLGLNNKGIAVGEAIVGGVNHGLIYDSKTGAFTLLDDPDAAGSTVFNGINEQGDIVGYYTDASGNTNGLLMTPSAATNRPAGGARLFGQHMASALVASTGAHGGALVSGVAAVSMQTRALVQPHAV